MQKPKAFTVSWFFAPYLGSADLDFFKRIKNCDLHFDVLQVKRGQRDERILAHTGAATLERHEVVLDHGQPRTRKVRDAFLEAGVRLFKARQREYELIVSHSNEVPSHAVALECKRLAPSLPWVAYFGDVVSTNPYVVPEKHPLHDEDCEIEAATFETADLIICNNDAQRRSMLRGPKARHAAKVVVIPHCFEPSMFSNASVPPNARFTFMHLGTLYGEFRTAAPLLLAVDRLIEIYPRYKDAFEVCFFGGPYYDPDLMTFARMANRSHVRLERPVPYFESLELMRRADVLVNIDAIFGEKEHGLDESPFFPGKLTDYMGASKPIMNITMPRGPVADLARESGNLIADDRIDRIAYVLKRYLDRTVNFRCDFRRYSAAIVGQEMETAFKAAMRGTAAIHELPRELADVVKRGLDEPISPRAHLRSVP